MKLYSKQGIEVLAVACRRPKMREHRGRTWDGWKFSIDGTELTCHLDTTWGEYAYFCFGEPVRWYKIPIDAIEPGAHEQPCAWFTTPQTEEIKRILSFREGHSEKVVAQLEKQGYTITYGNTPGWIATKNINAIKVVEPKVARQNPEEID